MSAKPPHLLLVEALFYEHIAADLRRGDSSDGKKLRQPLVNLLASWQGIENAPGVGQFLAHIFLGVHTASILQPAVRVGNLVAMNGFLDHVHLQRLR